MGEKRDKSWRMSVDAYLKFEERSPIRHEYVAGEVYAMSGPSVRHGLIATNIVAALHAPARARKCGILSADIKLRAASDRIYYPDVMIACGKALDVDLIIERPSLVAEVTSPRTHATDRREKLEAYLKIPSLREYLIVEQRRKLVVAYTRDARGEWSRVEIGGSGTVEIAFLETRLTLEQIYDAVPLPALTVREKEEWDEMYGFTAR